MASVAIEREAGIETIPHLTTRDMSIAGLESLLLGAHAEGVRNILAVTGDPPEEGDYPGARGVYEVDAIGLTRLDRRAEPRRGLPRARDRRTDVVLRRRRGQSVRRRPGPRARALRAQARGRRAVRDDAGALRPRLPGRVPRALGGRSPIPLLVGVWPMPSHQLAVRIHNEVPGIVVPDPVQERLRAAGADAARGRPRAGAGADRGVAREGRRASTWSRRSGSRSESSTCSSGRRGRIDDLARGRRRRGPRGRASSGRRSRAAEPMRDAKIVACTRPCASTAGPPELPCRTTPRRVVTRRRTGPRPYASSVRTVGRLADPAGRCGEGAVLRVAEDRYRLSLDPGRRAAAAATPRPATRSTATSSRASKATTSASRYSPSPLVDPCVLHPGDDVGVRDDEVRRRDPAGALDAEAAGGPGDAEDAGSRPATPALWSSAGSGGGDLRQRPADRRERVDARDRIEQPRRRHPLVDLAEDPRALHLLAQLRLAGHVQRDGAGDPDDRRPGRRAEHEPAERVEHAQRRHDEEARADRVARDRRRALDEHGRARPPRRVRRAACTRDSLPDRNCGASLAPRYAPAAIPASEKTPPMSPRRSPFSAASPITAAAIQSTVVTRSTLLTLPATLSVALGGVVQLVRTPACHAGGRGFESRRSRLRIYPASRGQSGSLVPRSLVRSQHGP